MAGIFDTAFGTQPTHLPILTALLDLSLDGTAVSYALLDGSTLVIVNSCYVFKNSGNPVPTSFGLLPLPVMGAVISESRLKTQDSRVAVIHAARAQKVYLTTIYAHT